MWNLWFSNILKQLTSSHATVKPLGLKCVLTLKDFAESHLEQSGFESGSGLPLGIKYEALIFLLRLAQLKPDNQPSTSVLAFKKGFKEHKHYLRLRKYRYVKYNTLLITYKNVNKIRYYILNEQKPEDSESELDQCLTVTGIFTHGQPARTAGVQLQEALTWITCFIFLFPILCSFVCASLSIKKF